MAVLAADTDFQAAPRPSLAERLDRHSGPIMVLPAVLILLAFAIFPLIVSGYLALSRFSLAAGSFKLRFVGLLNFKKLIVGSQQYHFLGTFGAFGAVQWVLLGVAAVGLLFLLGRYLRSDQVSIMGLIGSLDTGPGATPTTPKAANEGNVLTRLGRFLVGGLG